VFTKSAIIIGASSGIGRETAKALAARGYRLGLVARRENLLAELKEELGDCAIIKAFDIAEVPDSSERLMELISTMGGTDLIMIAAGTAQENPSLEWENTKNTIAVNVVGFAAMAQTAYRYFSDRATGHLVGITSISAIRGEDHFLPYSATKAFESNLLEALRVKARKSRLNIKITEIRPGFVDTELPGRRDKRFWAITAAQAGAGVVSAIYKGKRLAYVPARWVWFGWILKGLPAFAYEQLRSRFWDNSPQRH
jgi:short-subunit dehydrogenase